MLRRLYLFLLLGLAGLLANASSAQEAAAPGQGPPPQPSPPVEKFEFVSAEGGPGRVQSERDPFALGGRDVGDSGGLRFRPQAATSIPELQLRGIVNGADGSRVGLLQVGNQQVYMVRAGDTISLRTRNSASNTVINIREINQLTLIVESGTLGEVIIVR